MKKFNKILSLIILFICFSNSKYLFDELNKNIQITKVSLPSLIVSIGYGLGSPRLESYGIEIYQKMALKLRMEFKDEFDAHVWNESYVTKKSEKQLLGIFLILIFGTIWYFLIKPKNKPQNYRQVARICLVWGGLVGIVFSFSNLFYYTGEEAVLRFLGILITYFILSWSLGIWAGLFMFFAVNQFRKAKRLDIIYMNYNEFMSTLAKAQQGDTHSQFKLGECYYYGESVVKNTVEAYKWILLAQAGGIHKARGICSKIEKKLSEEEISRVQAMASEFVSEQAPESGTNEIA